MLVEALGESPPPRVGALQTSIESQIADSLQRLEEKHDVDRLRAAMPAAPPEPVAEFACSFCGAERRKVAKLITGPRVFICDACVREAAEVAARG